MSDTRTSCEEYGCVFETDEDDPNLRVCSDCGQSYEID